MTGPFRKKLVLEARVAVPDGSGGYWGEWEVLGTHWAEVILRSGRQEVGEGSARSRVSYSVRIRGVPPDGPSRPKPGQRFRDGNRVLHIRSVAEARSGNAFLECLTDEEVLP
ncbi:head-tail adaptor protein [Silicimonas sp. MF1-12-2]|uniref:head-tail adaptor protein n=1 Tax=Silicimonas sp. MF1-12-2 TaxID=3384793 RepID=UPI0039B43E1E